MNTELYITYLVLGAVIETVYALDSISVSQRLQGSRLVYSVSLPVDFLSLLGLKLFPQLYNKLPGALANVRL